MHATRRLPDPDDRIIAQGERLSPFLTRSAEAFGTPVCRLGLAWRTGSELTTDDVLATLDRGVNFLNWPGAADAPGRTDAFSEAIAALGPRRGSVVVGVQFGARTATEAAEELRSILAVLGTDYIDVLTLYYVEEPGEWHDLAAAGGVIAFCQSARRDGVIRRLGITSHQRPLAAEAARSGLIDTLMIRYNAAHRGAEREIFPVVDALGIPIIAYTALRWGALLKPTPADPPGFSVPSAPDWYRFALQAPTVAVTLAAPGNRVELAEDLEVLRASSPLDPVDYARLAEHGARVRRYAGSFP
jgi:predicted aldo/keto reductase-like oxidoreductase